MIFQIAGLTGQGALEAVCEADIHGIGVDVDQAVSLPDLAPCIVTSAEKKLVDTVTAVVTSVATDTFVAGTVAYNAASDPQAIGLAPYHDNEALITPEIQAADRHRARGHRRRVARPVRAHQVHGQRRIAPTGATNATLPRGGLRTAPRGFPARYDASHPGHRFPVTRSLRPP